MKNVKLLLVLAAVFLLFSCSTDRQLVSFEELETDLSDPEFTVELKTKVAPRPKLPPVWRGRKLFTSPWAYIYAKNKEAAEYIYDQLEDLSNSEERAESYGLVVVTSSEDTETAFDYKEIRKLYDEILSEGELLEEEAAFFKKDIEGLDKIEEFRTKVNEKADEKKEENDLAGFRNSIDHIITYATFFIQPEIMERYMKSPIDDSVYWCAFMSVDDSIDENLDGIISSIMDDYEVSMLGKGIVWGIISPSMYFHKRKVISKTQETFAEGYQKYSQLNKGDVKFSDKVIRNQEAGVKGSE